MEEKRERETRHYKNAKNENEKPSIKKKKKMPKKKKKNLPKKKKKKEREKDVKYKIVYISGTADERMVT